MIRPGIALAFGLLALSACTHFAQTKTPVTRLPAASGTYEKITFTRKRATRAGATKCEAAGGRVEPGGMLGHDLCVQTYPDAGKACMSASDCIGRCLLAPGSSDDVDQTSDDGICQTTDSPFGCHADVDSGKVQWTICID